MKKNGLIYGLTVYGERSIIENGYVRVREGKIAEVGKGDARVFKDEIAIECPKNYRLIPGMIDVHIHGAAGADVMDATEEALTTIATALPKEGTTSFLATTLTERATRVEAALRNASAYMDNMNDGPRAEVLGVHLEGPFISEKRAGAQPKEFIVEPDPALFQKWQRLARGRIKLVTLAPEQKGGLELVRCIKETGAVASIGHSDATCEQTLAGIQAGLTHATHLYNGMRGLHHREPGVVGATLLHPELKAEIIVDGIHSDPRMVQLAYANKGREGIVLITDAMRAKGLGNGRFSFGGQEVVVKDGEARLKDGTLAGSVLAMDEAARNMMTFTGCSLEDVVWMAAMNPAKQLGVYDRKGSVRAGKDADLVVLDDRCEVVMTVCRGQIAYKK